MRNRTEKKYLTMRRRSKCHSSHIFASATIRYICDYIRLIQYHGLADRQILGSLLVSCVIRLAGDFTRETPSRAPNLEETWRHCYSE